MPDSQAGLGHLPACCLGWAVWAEKKQGCVCWQEDLKLTEQALSKHSQQHLKSLEGADGGLQRLAGETSGLRARLEALEEVVSSQRVELLDAAQRMALLQRDSSQRHRHLRAALSSFAEALGLSPDKLELGPMDDDHNNHR